jgi:peptidoglycan/LPS O-acetylase OafA/YrhL
LNYEIFFYLVFSLCLTLSPPRGLVALTGIMAGLALLGLFLDPGWPPFAFWTNSIILEFLFGVVLAEIWLRTGHRVAASPVATPFANHTLGAGILAGGFVLLVVLETAAPGLPRAVSAGLPATIMVAGPLFLWQGAEGPRLPRWMILIGDSSYALYLSHRFVLRAATLLIVPWLPATALGAWVYVGLVCGIAVVTGILVFRWIETPMLTALGRRFLPARPLIQPA